VILVTGGSGFIGAHIVRALLDDGATVRCLVRDERPRANLAGLDVEIVQGDLTTPDSLGHALDGVQVLYHCAADYRLYARRPGEIYRTNVDGTRHLLQAAGDAGVERIVYTSSVGALGLNGDGQPGNEATPVALDDMIGHYKRSKFLAEREAEAAAGRGLPVVVVNPSAPVGELDVKPTPTGQMIVDFLDGKMPFYVDTGLNLVDVRDVARGHLLAAEKGRVGERYILGGENLTLKAILELLSDLTGRPAPRRRIPHWIPTVAAAVDTGLARLLGRTPRVSLEAVRMSRHRMFFDAGKAVRELGLPQSPVRAALARAVAWFREHGYLRDGAEIAPSGA
jgi:dihydroflavonol-4-reductase